MNIKAYFFDQLKSFFLDKGYKFYANAGPRFILKQDNYVVQTSFNYLAKAKKIYGGKLNLSLNEVEDIIIEIQFPNQIFTSYLDKKEDFFATIGDKEGILNFSDVELDTEEKIIDHTNEIKKYIDNYSEKFIKKFTYLPNVLKEIDKLEIEGKYWNELLAGGPEFLFRGLIISKLCNDEKYENKLLYVESLLKSMADEYLPYFEKLKLRLKSLEPKYNIK
ncbi:hypothetical protein [Flavobacterium geliluteum]|uniref:Uncharacterized protein n=1 Tax=Flavobacterium geliluteum TaxID=2816120 RepID=A0A940X7T5_9FLAO|nr:hypothetical protein [Flavobacterium geliluteum]MBP4137581.1 hypothetical protein [Flavobacterium geliluteum]